MDDSQLQNLRSQIEDFIKSSASNKEILPFYDSLSTVEEQAEFNSHFMRFNMERYFDFDLYRQSVRNSSLEFNVISPTTGETLYNSETTTVETGGEIFSEQAPSKELLSEEEKGAQLEPPHEQHDAPPKDDPQTIPDTNTVTGSDTNEDVATDPPVNLGSETETTAETGSEGTTVETGSETETTVETGSEGTTAETGSEGTTVETGSEGTTVETGSETETTVETGSEGTTVETGSEGTTVETGSETETTVETGSEGTTVETGSETETTVETGSETETTVETGSETETTVETGSEGTAVETGSETETTVETGSETETTVETGSETETTVETGSETETTVETGSEGTTAETGSETETTVETGSEGTTDPRDPNSVSYDLWLVKIPVGYTEEVARGILQEKQELLTDTVDNIIAQIQSNSSVKIMSQKQYVDVQSIRYSFINSLGEPSDNGQTTYLDIFFKLSGYEKGNNNYNLHDLIVSGQQNEQFALDLKNILEKYELATQEEIESILANVISQEFTTIISKQPEEVLLTICHLVSSLESFSGDVQIKVQDIDNPVEVIEDPVATAEFIQQMISNIETIKNEYLSYEPNSFGILVALNNVLMNVVQPLMLTTQENIKSAYLKDFYFKKQNKIQKFVSEKGFNSDDLHNILIPQWVENSTLTSEINNYYNNFISSLDYMANIYNELINEAEKVVNEEIILKVRDEFILINEYNSEYCNNIIEKVTDSLVETTPTVQMGPQGEAGSTGPQGSTGSQGEVGSAGPQGSAGSQGEVGSAGPQGLKGDQGIIGQTGVGITNIVLSTDGYLLITTSDNKQYKVGPAIGPKGDKGDQGAAGTSGANASEDNIISKIIEFIKKIISQLFTKKQ